MTTAEEEWQKLCEENRIAYDNMHKAIFPVIKKQGAIARGQSRENPNADELTDLFTAKEKCDAINLRMNEFIERNFGKK